MNRTTLLKWTALLFVGGCTATLADQDEDETGAFSGGSTNGGTTGENSGGGGTTPDDIQFSLTQPFECESISLCSSYQTDRDLVPMPSSTGGTLQEGLYRVASGSQYYSGFYFQGGRFSQIWTDLLVGHGSYEIDGDRLSTTTEFSCSHNGTFEFSSISTTQYTFAASGNELYLRSDCYGPHCDGGAMRFERVSSLCDGEANFECQEASCSCREFLETSIPEKGDGEDDCAI